MIYKHEISFPPTGRMNYDAEPRNLPEGDILYALNCRWGKNDKGAFYAVENIIGTKGISFTLPNDGESKIIGACNDLRRQYVYLFLYNERGEHGIVRFEILSQSITLIIWKEPILNFDNRYMIHNPVFIDNGDDGEGLLYWTDGLNPPSKINVEKARKKTFELYPDGIGYWVIEDDNIVH